MNAKNGVITEDRFKTMTVPQWIFHYQEVMKFKTEQLENESQKMELNFKMYESLKNTLKSYLEMVAVFANPRAGKEYFESKDIEVQRDELTPEMFAEQWEDIKNQIPKFIEVPHESETQKYFLPKFERKEKKSNLGIKIG